MPLHRTLTAVLLFAGAASLAAHPVPDGEFDRVVSVEVRDRSVRVVYRLEIDEITLFRVIPTLDDPRVKKLKARDDFARLYLERLRKLVPDRLTLTVNDEPVALAVEDARFDPLDSMQFRFYLRGEWKTDADTVALQLVENNQYPEYPVQKGRLRLVLEPRFRGEITGWFEPREVRFNADEIPEKDRSVTIKFRTGMPKEEAVAPLPEPKPSEPTKDRSLFDRVHDHGLTALFDSSAGLGVLLFLAALFGAAHALTPGHGKTMVAAYLVGERGTVFHAVLLGLIVTVTHTGAVILLAWLLAAHLPTTSAATAAATVGFVGGFLILIVGAWLFLQRIRNRPDHVHLFSHGDHSHSHSHSHGAGHEHSHSHSESLGRAGWKRLVLLGIAGGLIPCTDAIVLLLFAVSSQQLWLGVPLLFAFSAGLASVLVAVGVAVVYATRLGRATFRERRWFKLLPIISSLLVVAIGFWMCADNVSVLGAGRK